MTLQQSYLDSPESKLHQALYKSKKRQSDNLSSLPYDEFAYKYMKVVTKSATIEPFNRNRLQRHFYEARQQSDKKFHLIIKARQGGVSTDIQGEMFYRAITGPILGATMANDDDNTAHMRNMSTVYYDNLPDDIQAKRGIDNASTTTYLPTGSKIRIGTAGGKQKGRSGTYTFFHGSEVAFWKDPAATIAGALQGLVPGGTCIFETTANGAQGWVWEKVNNPGKWQIHFYAWWWSEEYALPLDYGEEIKYTDNELKCIALAKLDGFDLTPEQIKWRRDKQVEVGQKFRQEYPESLKEAFIVSGDSAFDNFSAVLYPAVGYENNDSAEYHDGQGYNTDHYYVAGIDWGQSNDWTVLSIWDVDEKREVYLGRWHRMAWDDMLNRVIRASADYQVDTIYPEANAMSMQIEALQNQLAPLWGCAVSPLFMTNDLNRYLQNIMYRAIHERDEIYPAGMLLDVAYASSEMTTYQSLLLPNGGYRFKHIDGCHDDSVIARELALHGCIKPKVASIAYLD